MQYTVRQPIEAFLLGVDPIPDWFMDYVTKNIVILHRIPFDESRPQNYGKLWCEIHLGNKTVNGYEGKDMITQWGVGDDDTLIEVIPKTVFDSIFKPMEV